MAGLLSELFKGDAKLEACLVKDAAHVTLNTRGDHVMKIQYAVMTLTGEALPGSELIGRVYGPATAKLVKKYKTDRKIINFSYQKQADDIVGKMTIAQLDREMLVHEAADLLVNLVPRILLR